MPEGSASGAVSLREFVPSTDKALEGYDVFIGEGKVSLVPVESSANLSVDEARRLVRSTDAIARQALVDAFVGRIGNSPDIAEIWLVREADPLALAVIVRNFSLDRDLQLRAAFADLTYEHDAELRIYADTDERAELGRRGERLRG
jgi:hypothetical protein